MTALAAYTGKLALVTGAGDGIGEMLARRLASAGLRVCVQDIRGEAAARVAKDIGAAAFSLPFDVSDRAATLAAAGELRARGETLHLLWINAGVGLAAPIIAGPANAIEWAFAVNVLGVVWTAQAFVPLMGEAPGARHVGLTASVAALHAPEGPFPLYAATKHAAFALGEALRGELQAMGIGMTLLCPGLLNTNIWDGTRARPDRFGGPQSMNPAVATRWREAKRPDLMWPHVERAIANGGGYLVCATDGGEIEGLLERRTRAIRDGIERI